MGDDVSKSRTPDQNAAHEFLVELSTRIATRRLPYQHGVEAAALESLRKLFDAARDAMKKYPGCVGFMDLVIPVLNRDVRPVTAKWHKALEEKRLASRDGGDEFRGELEQLRGELCALEKELRKMAYGVAAGDAPKVDKDKFEVELDADIGALFQEDLVFGIVPQELYTKEDASAAIPEINVVEAEEVAKRRGLSGSTSPHGANAVGLSLSGGGIRSATFCLGVVQILAARGLLKDVDFLSTVSGGGYTGSFLTSRLGAGAPHEDMGNPHGPDSNAIAFLRQHAKYLSAIDLKQRWSMVTATLAGLLLNWCVPFFFLALLALFAVNYTDVVPYSWWEVGLEALLGFTVVALLYYAYAMRGEGTAANTAGKALGALIAACLACAAGWGLQAGFFKFYAEVQQNACGASGPPFPWAGTLGVASVVSAFPAILRIVPLFENPRMREWALRVALIAAGLLVPVCAVIIFYIFCALGVADSTDFWCWHLPRGSVLWALLAFFGLVSLFLLNVNLTSPHRLYRDQLAKTFIARDEKDEAPKPLAEVNASGRAPYHLINAAVNLPSGKSSALRDRKCDFFLMSKHWLGSPSTGYKPVRDWRMNRGSPDLASAMAISGAAVSSRMGLGTQPALSALLTFLNARLGFWIRNANRESWIERKVPLVRRWTKAPGFWCLLREMFGLWMSEDAAWLNLSDGGHIENMGVYELLRRRCKFVVCVDGEADPEITFHGFMTMIRHAQIDLGVRIDARLDDLRPDPATKLSRSHWEMFRIRYPAVDGTPPKTGLLLYLKLSVTGNESELIRRYRITHPDFPHQSTLDQFFDQEQFEAYRQLGVHVGESLFKPAITGNNPNPPTMSAWFRSLAYNLLEPK